MFNAPVKIIQPPYYPRRIHMSQKIANRVIPYRGFTKNFTTHAGVPELADLGIRFASWR